MVHQSDEKHVIAVFKESRLNFPAIHDSHIQKGRIQFFIGATRLDNDGENEFLQFFIGATRLDHDGKNESLLACKSILHMPVKHRKKSYITKTAGSA